MEMKESGGMPLQSIGEGHSQSLVVKKKEQLLNTLVKDKEDVVLLGMKAEKGQHLVRIDEDGQFSTTVLKMDEGLEVKYDEDCT